MSVITLNVIYNFRLITLFSVDTFRYFLYNQNTFNCMSALFYFLIYNAVEKTDVNLRVNGATKRKYTDDGWDIRIRHCVLKDSQLYCTARKHCSIVRGLLYCRIKTNGLLALSYADKAGHVAGMRLIVESNRRHCLHTKG